MGNICGGKQYKGAFTQGKEKENSKKDKAKEDKKNIDDIKKDNRDAPEMKYSHASKVKKVKVYKTKNHKKSKDASGEILDGTNNRNEMSWERVIEIFDMENPDTKCVLKASDTALKLSRDAFQEKDELVKQSKKLWSQHEQARDSKETVVMRLKEAKSEWKKRKAITDNDSDEMGQEYEAYKNYKEIKEDKKIAETIAEDSLDSFLKLQNTIIDKEKKYNQDVQKINASVARLKEREKKAFCVAKKRIIRETKILQEAAKMKDDTRDMMNKSAKAAEDAKEKFVKMEDMVASAREEYEKEVNKVCCGKKKLQELDKFIGLTEFKESGINLDTGIISMDTDSGKETDFEELEIVC